MESWVADDHGRATGKLIESLWVDAMSPQ